MENLNETINIVEPVEVLEQFETVSNKDQTSMVIGAVVITGLVAGGVMIKRLLDKRKSKTSKDDVVIIESAGNVNNPGENI